MKIPEQILLEEVRVNPNDPTCVLPAGAHVKILDPYYLPKHVLERESHFNPKTSCFIYTRYGIIVVNKKLVKTL